MLESCHDIPGWLVAFLTFFFTLGLTFIFLPALSVEVVDKSMCTECQLPVDYFKEQTPVEDVLLSVVVPAYNEEERIEIMLQNAHAYLSSSSGENVLKRLQHCVGCSSDRLEFLIVDDGSKDSTCKIVKEVFRSLHSNHPWNLVSLNKNYGKGAAVKIGMLLSKGRFRLMVDADGATDFGPGLETVVDELVSTTEKASGSDNLAVFGSRAHLQNDPQTRRSFARTILMYSFHFFVRLLVSSRIKDTQCGFKLFTKEAATTIFSSLHLQRWAFDTEIVILSDIKNIQIKEVAVPWHEVDGSKLNTSKFALAVVSLTMLRDMICVRLCYLLKIWKVATNPS